MCLHRACSLDEADDRVEDGASRLEGWTVGPLRAAAPRMSQERGTGTRRERVTGQDEAAVIPASLPTLLSTTWQLPFRVLLIVAAPAL